MGLAAIYWNVRRIGGTPFLDRYEQLLRRHCADYVEIAERHGDGAIMRRWFGRGFRDAAEFEHRQSLDFDGLIGRVMSSSYVPAAGQPEHEPLMNALRDLFEQTSENGRIGFDYDTRIFVGEVLPS